MKMVISPAKSLNFKTALPTSTFTEPCFLKEAVELNASLREASVPSLMKMMHISEKLAQLNWQRNQDFKSIYHSDNARQAVYTFDGDVYTGLDVFTLPEALIGQMQKRLRILSGLYGLLKPLDLIQPYRLEMGTKYAFGTHKNLYDFWKEKITRALNEELGDEDILVNLASNEYFSAIEPKGIKSKVIAPQFKDFKNGKLKVISFFAKRARGAMVRYLLEHEVHTPEGILGFNHSGYAYSEAHTDNPLNPVFIR